MFYRVLEDYETDVLSCVTRNSLKPRQSEGSEKRQKQQSRPKQVSQTDTSGQQPVVPSSLETALLFLDVIISLVSK